jgi:hypothetical protein
MIGDLRTAALVGRALDLLCLPNFDLPAASEPPAWRTGRSDR